MTWFLVFCLFSFFFFFVTRTALYSTLTRLIRHTHTQHNPLPKKHRQPFFCFVFTPPPSSSTFRASCLLRSSPLLSIKEFGFCCVMEPKNDIIIRGGWGPSLSYPIVLFWIASRMRSFIPGLYPPHLSIFPYVHIFLLSSPPLRSPAPPRPPTSVRISSRPILITNVNVHQ